MPETTVISLRRTLRYDHGAGGWGHAQGVRARVPERRFVGRGGPKMRALASESFVIGSMKPLSVGLWEVIRPLPFFESNFRTTISAIAAVKQRSRADRLPRI